METLINNYSVKVQKFKNGHPNFTSTLYLIALVLFIVASMIKNSQLLPLVTQKSIFVLEAVSALIVTIKIFFFDEHTSEELAIFILLEFYLYMSSYIAASVAIFYFSLLIVGSKNVETDQILKVFILTNVIFIIIAAALALTGIIWNYSNTRGIYSPVVRYALGMAYPTDYAARGLSILLAYAVLKKFCLSIPEYISFITVTIWFYLITRTRVDLFLSVILLITLFGFSKIKKYLKNVNYVKINITMIIYMALIYLIGFLYTLFSNNKILNIINKLLSGRLTHEKTLFQQFSLSFTGRYIYQPGGGAGFYIDSTFFRILWMYGIPMLFLFIVLIFLLNKRFTHDVNYLPIELAFIIFFISAGIDQHFLDASFNFIPLLLYANLDMFKIKSR